MRTNYFLLLSFMLTLCLACQNTGAVKTSKAPVQMNVSNAVSAADFVREMGIGVNIGNTLDSIGDKNHRANETSWGNPMITKNYIKALKDFGYTTVRLPVTWADNTGPAPDYKIDDDWMERVEEVVNWILEEGMFCIINLHHDGGGADRSWIRQVSGDSKGVNDRFVKIWTQIAKRFSYASNYLILESMNEVSATYPRFNNLNQLFVDTVRKSGGNNRTRYLLIAGFDTDIDRTCNFQFEMPKDSQKDKLILSIHYYTPSTFCIAEDITNSWGFRSDWGNAETKAADDAELVRQFDKLKSYYIDKGIPVIIGEYGVTVRDTKVEEGRIRWLTAVTRACLEYGMCPVLWETGLGTGGFIQRRSPFRMSETLKAVWHEINSVK